MIPMPVDTLKIKTKQPKTHVCACVHDSVFTFSVMITARKKINKNIFHKLLQMIFIPPNGICSTTYKRVFQQHINHQR